MSESPKPPVVLSLAGFDPGGGAGVLVDVKTIHALGGYALAVITAQTVQNTLTVGRIVPTDAALFQDQVETLLADTPPQAIKIGMMGSGALARCLVTILDQVSCPVVLDPILWASHGAPLIDEDGLSILKKDLLPRITCVTPNTIEAALLPLSHAPAVFITGGHEDGTMIVNVLREGGKETRFSHPRIPTRHTHGTGCILSSALATGLARGLSLPQAAEDALAFIQKSLKNPPGVGQGTGPVL
jgi:hydroxymethylpyrimidine/phosphomethylpyrimidine kinase